MTHGIISGPQPEAVEAGAIVFKDGGNAVDAAIACAIVQTAVDPQMCGIAGFLRSDGGPAEEFSRQLDTMTDLLAHLGPEPLSDNFNGDYLYSRSTNRREAVKNFIMDGRIVVGVGNIYASEALYLAGIHPSRAAGRLSLKRYHQLCTSIEQVLRAAIKAGGTTLRDYMSIDGRAGYFEQELHMYGREGFPCHHCGTTIKRRIIGQRRPFYCAPDQRCDGGL